VINSPTFAGYLASVARGSATSSAARFTVPRVSCTRTPVDRAITIEARGDTYNFRSHSSALLFAGCHARGAVYFPALVINGNEVNYTTTKAALAYAAEAGRIQRRHVDSFAHIVLAAANETAMMIARADDPAAALRAGESAFAEFLDRLLDGAGRPDGDRESQLTD
jgi:hypothetical protein